MTSRLIDHLLFHGNPPSPGGNGGGDWILALNTWNDSGIWEDAATWND